MHKIFISTIALVLAAALPSPASSQSEPAKKAPVTQRALGTFDVKIAPLTPYNAEAGAAVSRMSIDKQFKGDLEATSKGEMLGGGDYKKGSAGYVALEYVTGKLNGKSGSFALQHNGTMHRGNTQLSVSVVPGSGTGELAGLSGKMNIIIAEGKHSYEFDYSLEAAP